VHQRALAIFQTACSRVESIPVLSPTRKLSPTGKQPTTDRKGAIEILKLNATAYPNSPNVYDRLSDAYLADGHKDLSRRNAKRALELLNSDTTDNEETRNQVRASTEQKRKQLGAVISDQ
jgi:hypothetical protein